MSSGGRPGILPLPIERIIFAICLRAWRRRLTSSIEVPLPAAIRQNVANLGIFVFSHTLAIMANPRPESLGSLININRELAAGLLGHA